MTSKKELLLREVGGNVAESLGRRSSSNGARC